MRCLRSQGWMPARLHWTDVNLDLALLEVARAAWRAPTPAKARWGRLYGTQPVEFTAVGFRDAQRRPDDSRESEQVSGVINPLTNARGDRLALKVTSGAPRDLTEHRTLWAGISGAGVFAGSGALLVVRGPGSGRRKNATPK